MKWSKRDRAQRPSYRHWSRSIQRQEQLMFTKQIPYKMLGPIALQSRVATLNLGPKQLIVSSLNSKYSNRAVWWLRLGSSYLLWRRLVSMAVSRLRLFGQTIWFLLKRLPPDVETGPIRSLTRLVQHLIIRSSQSTITVKACLFSPLTTRRQATTN